MSQKAKIFLISVIVVLGFGIAIYFLTHSKVSDTELLYGLIIELERAIETKNILACLSCISPNYSDSHGYNYWSLRRVIISGFRSLRGDQIEVVINNPKLNLEGESAKLTAEAEAFVISGYGLRDRYSAYIRLYFAKEKGKWKITRSEGWQRDVEGL